SGGGLTLHQRWGPSPDSATRFQAVPPAFAGGTGYVAVASGLAAAAEHRDAAADGEQREGGGLGDHLDELARREVAVEGAALGIGPVVHAEGEVEHVVAVGFSIGTGVLEDAGEHAI